MITKERAKRAKEHLLDTANRIEAHIAKVREMEAGDFLDKWDGKVVNRRIFVPMARLYGCEERQGMSGPYFPEADFKFGYMPAPLTGTGVPSLCVKVCEGWGDFEIPLVCDWDHNYKLNACSTRNAWDQILELRQKWADERKAAASFVDKAARVYNRIEKDACDLIKQLDVKGSMNLDITVLKSFGGDIYSRLSPFRWYEKEPEVK